MPAAPVTTSPTPTSPTQALTTAAAQTLNISSILFNHNAVAVSTIDNMCEVWVKFSDHSTDPGQPQGDVYKIHPRSNCTNLQLNLNMTVPSNMSRAKVSWLINMKARVIDAGPSSGRRLNTVSDSTNLYLCFIDMTTGKGYLTNGPAYSHGYQCSYPNQFAECVCGFDMPACNDFISQTETSWRNAGCTGLATSKAARCYYSYFGLAAQLDGNVPSCTGCSTSQCTALQCQKAGASC